MTSNVWHCFCSLLVARKNTGACYTSALSCHTASCRAQQCWKQDQKYETKTKTKTNAARPRPRPRPVWDSDRSCHKTALSDPKTVYCKQWKIWNKKLSCCCDSRSCCLRSTAYWQTVKPVSFTRLRTAGTHDPIQRVEFINAPKLNPLKRDWPKFTKSVITRSVHAWLSVSKQ